MHDVLHSQLKVWVTQICVWRSEFCSELPCANKTSLEMLRRNLYSVYYGNNWLFPSWQKELLQTFEEISGYVRPERVNKWPNSMTDR
jgi:hypothetical protein